MLLIKSIIYTSLLRIHQKFGNKILKTFGANIWNTLPKHIKWATSLLEFRKIMKTSPGPKYQCSACK